MKQKIIKYLIEKISKTRIENFEISENVNFDVKKYLIEREGRWTHVDLTVTFWARNNGDKENKVENKKLRLFIGGEERDDHNLDFKNKK